MGLLSARMICRGLLRWHNEDHTAQISETSTTTLGEGCTDISDDELLTCTWGADDHH